MTGDSKRVAAALALAVAACCVYAVRQVDPDFWGYLSAGRLFAEQGLGGADPFAYTSAGARWITFEYGAELVLWHAYRIGGPLGLLAIKCLLGGVCFACLYATFRTGRAGAATWLPLFLLAAAGTSRFFLFRPQLFTFALFGLFELVLFRHLAGRRSPLWALPLAMVAWVNTHGGFVAGLGAIGLAIVLQASASVASSGWQLAAIVRRTRTLGITLGLSALATLLNPLGVRVWGYVLAELTHTTNRRYIKEWQAATLARDPFSVWALVVMACSLAVVLLGVWMRRRERTASPVAGPPPLAWAASAAPLIAMAFLSVRHTPLALMWSGPVVAMLACDAGEALSRGALRRAWFVARGLACVPAVLTVLYVLSDPRPGIRTDGAVLGPTHPCRAIEFMRAAGVKGNVYNPLWWGSYITWHLHPDVRVSMDGRNITLFPDSMVEENMRFYVRPAAEVDAGVPLRYDTDVLIVPADSPALQRVRQDRRWREIYSDTGASLFGRTDRAITENRVTPASMQTFSCPAVFE